jgi:cobalt-zinc-cadmium resistance protein CzcA
MVSRIRRVLEDFPEVNEVLSQTGRSNDGTDPSGFYYMQCQVNLKPKEVWERNITMDQLIEEMDGRLRQFQGINYNYSQPIIDNVQEAVAGINANNAVKIYGPDLHKLEELAAVVSAALTGIDGCRDVGVLSNLGQPELRIELNEERMARYGVQMADAQAVIEMAVGGKTISEMYEGERKFDIRLRFAEPFRNSLEAISEILVPTLNNNRVPLKLIANIGYHTGPAFVYRDANSRFIGVKFTVRGRDLGSTIEDAQASVNQALEGKLPTGYRLVWTGEFENMVRASNRLVQVVPVALLLIFLILFATFGSLLDASLVLITVPFALIGGIAALLITGTEFGISAGIGFIALFGICVQNGVILVSEFKHNLKGRLPLARAIRQGVQARVRPVVMTALMAAIGLFPAAISTGIGSETQRPLARVVIGGLVTATILTLLIFPVMAEFAYSRGSRKNSSGGNTEPTLGEGDALADHA